MPSSPFLLPTLTINRTVQLPYPATVSDEIFPNFPRTREKNDAYLLFLPRIRLSLFHPVFRSAVNRKVIHSTLVYTLFEIFKSSSATAISVLSHVSHFLYTAIREKKRCKAEARIFYNFIWYTYIYIWILYRLYVYFTLYIHTYRGEFQRGCMPSFVCDTRRCWKFCEITQGNTYTQGLSAFARNETM